MAGKKDNIKALFSNTKTRTIIIFTGIILVSVIVFGVVRFFSASSAETTPESNAGVGRAPNRIRSIPGALNQTAQYAALQEEQNTEQAQLAKKTGTSAIPTIIRTQAFGEGVDLIGPKNGEGTVGFATLSLAEQAGTQQSLWTDELKKDACNQVTLKRIIAEGAAIKELRPMCSCDQLKNNGYTLKELVPVCSCPELKSSGYGAADLKALGYTAEKLKQCGFSACETRGAGFSAAQMKDGGYSDGELQGAGFSDQNIAQAGGIPEGMTAADIRQAGCNPDNLRRLRGQGVSAAAIIRISGCPAAQLKVAGFSATDLKAAGLSAAQLKNAGFNAAELKAAGFDARSLLNAGFDKAALKAAGLSDQEIAAGDGELPPGMTLLQLQKAGCSDATIQREALAGVSPQVIAKAAGCTSAAIKNAGCDLIKLKQLKERGVSAKQVHDLNGCSDVTLKAVGFNTNSMEAEIKAAGCDADKLKKLRAQGITAKQIHDLNGCSAAILKAAGFDAAALADAGFSPAELLAAGFTPSDLNTANLIPAAVIASGRTANCNVESLKAAYASGVTAKTIKETLGCSASALKAAGYSAQQIKQAGFSAAELKTAGFNANDLKAAGYSAKDLASAGFSPTELKAVGFSANDLKAAGYSAKDLASAGFSPTELKAAGFSANDLSAAGFPVENAKTVDTIVQAPIVIPPVHTMPMTPAQVQAKELQKMMSKQNAQANDQRYQAQIKQKTSAMMSAAKESLQSWKKSPGQVFVSGSKKEKDDGLQDMSMTSGSVGAYANKAPANAGAATESATIKTGDILFAVMDTSVNTDEPGPILATIVSGRLKGAKLIGSFTLPSNASKMVIMFNTISIPGKDKTVSISAYAIDPNTARTALSSETNHHYMQRYGALFASSFMAGMSSAIQSANTTVSVGGTGGNTNTTVSTLSRSTLDNTLIALGEVGKAWSKTAQKDMNRPTTVEVYAGTGLGILFTQDVTL